MLKCFLWGMAAWLAVTLACGILLFLGIYVENRRNCKKETKTEEAQQEEADEQTA